MVKTTENWLTLKQLNGDALPHGRMIKLFVLLQLFCEGKKLTIEQMAKRLNTSTRTIYRYIILMETLNIGIDKDWRHRYFLAQDSCPLCRLRRDTIPFKKTSSSKQ